MVLLDNKRARGAAEKGGEFFTLAFAAVGIGEIPSDPSFLTDRAEKLAQFEVNIWVILDLIDKLHQVRLGWYSLEDSEGIQM